MSEFSAFLLNGLAFMGALAIVVVVLALIFADPTEDDNL